MTAAAGYAGVAAGHRAEHFASWPKAPGRADDLALNQGVSGHRRDRERPCVLVTGFEKGLTLEYRKVAVQQGNAETIQGPVLHQNRSDII